MYDHHQNFMYVWPSGFVYYTPVGYYSCIECPKVSETMCFEGPEIEPEELELMDNSSVSLCKKRGAPVKFKNNLADIYEIKNSKGKPFKFSFACQNLMAHLQHLFDLKGKSRYKKTRWLRSYTKVGLAIQGYIKKLVGRNIDSISFKRTLSMTELKMWLHGAAFKESEPLDQDQSAQLRCRVFRAFCVLKSIDIDQQYLVDFNVSSAQAHCGQIFRNYILKTIWQEVGMPEISQEEIQQIMALANK